MAAEFLWILGGPASGPLSLLFSLSLTAIFSFTHSFSFLFSSSRNRSVFRAHSRSHSFILILPFSASLLRSCSYTTSLCVPYHHSLLFLFVHSLSLMHSLSLSFTLLTLTLTLSLTHLTSSNFLESFTFYLFLVSQLLSHL